MTQSSQYNQEFTLSEITGIIKKMYAHAKEQIGSHIKVYVNFRCHENYKVPSLVQAKPNPNMVVLNFTLPVSSKYTDDDIDDWFKKDGFIFTVSHTNPREVFGYMAA